MITLLPLEYFNSPRDIREGRLRRPTVGECIRVEHAAPGTGYNYYAVMGLTNDDEVICFGVSKKFAETYIFRG
jgi:hypothetical protein